MIIKKCPNLHRTHHFFFLAIAMMDIFVCLLTLPFIMDSHGKKLNWKLPEYLCKFYMFADFSLKGVHAYLLLLGAIFLYFHYRKNESYATETGEVRTRGSKMHKWAIPLAWVLGLGIGVPAGAMATMDTCGRCELWHSMDGQGRHRPAQGSEANILLAFLVGGFIVPVVLMLMPLIALFMQLCGGRTPRLDPPHSRTALLMVILMVLFISSRAPHDIYELMKMYSNQFGNRGNAYRMYGPSVELDCMVYIPMLLHPILFILLQPEYRQGFRDMMRSCGGSSTPQAENPYGEGRQRRLVPPQSSIIRGGGGRRGQQQNGHGQLIHERQPMIVAAPGGMAGHNRTHQGQLMQGSAYIQQQGMQQGMQGMRMSPQSQPLLQQGQLDNSFEMQQQDPSLPARCARPLSLKRMFVIKYLFMLCLTKLSNLFISPSSGSPPESSSTLTRHGWSQRSPTPRPTPRRRPHRSRTLTWRPSSSPTTWTECGTTLGSRRPTPAACPPT
jgi:hypothetical protein